MLLELEKTFHADMAKRYSGQIDCAQQCPRLTKIAI